MPARPAASSRGSDRTSNVGTVERYASMLAGGLLVAYGATHRSRGGILLVPIGSYLLYRGATAHCALYEALHVNTATAPLAGRSITVARTITVNRPVREVYCFWRDVENLPRFMAHLDAVTATGEGRSHWVARGPLGATVEWDAEIINEQQDRLIAWRSLGDTAVPNAGFVRFEGLPDGRGTQVKVSLEYSPPAGLAGSAAAWLLGQEPHRQVDEDLRRFKELLEAGEAPMTRDQPRGRAIGDQFHKGREKQLDKIGRGDHVQKASEASFPASDPPSWTSREGSEVR